jgi:hypothetical protein
MAIVIEDGMTIVPYREGRLEKRSISDTFGNNTIIYRRWMGK